MDGISGSVRKSEFLKSIFSMALGMGNIVTHGTGRFDAGPGYHEDDIRDTIYTSGT